MVLNYFYTFSLNKDYRKRASAEELLNHTFITKYA